jgi:hypothetical protein
LYFKGLQNERAARALWRVDAQGIIYAMIPIGDFREGIEFLG